MNDKKGPGGKKDKRVEQDVIYFKQDETLPTAIIVDIDGTVALINGRSPFDATKWHEDVPHKPIINLIGAAMYGLAQSVKKLPTVIFMTGREGGEKNRQKTLDWLYKHTPFVGVPHESYELHMRAPDDYRGDVDVKREMFEKHVKNKYNVLWVFEDRDKMVNFWRNELQLPTLQVKDGDY